MQEAKLALGRDEQHSVRFRDPARHLGEELGARGADGDREAHLVTDRRAQPHGDLDRTAGDLPQPADVQERFVDGDAFDERSGVLEDGEHCLARLDVGLEARRDDHGLWAELARLPAAHAGPDPERLGLVARGEHDAAADKDRPAAQARSVPLLDGRVERVQVRMQDHEYMFEYSRPAVNGPRPGTVERVSTLAITLAIEPAAQRRFEDECARWSASPVRAHIALFRELPEEIEKEIRVELVGTAGPPFPIGVAGVLPMPTGVAYAIASPELLHRHHDLQNTLWSDLTPADRRPLRPHVVVLRDASAAEARAAYNVLRREFRAYQVRADGYLLWRTDDEWTELAHIPFA